MVPDGLELRPSASLVGRQIRSAIAMEAIRYSARDCAARAACIPSGGKARKPNSGVVYRGSNQSLPPAQSNVASSGEKGSWREGAGGEEVGRLARAARAELVAAAVHVVRPQHKRSEPMKRSHMPSAQAGSKLATNGTPCSQSHLTANGQSAKCCPQRYRSL